MKGNVSMAKITWYRYVFEDGSWFELAGRLKGRELEREIRERGKIVKCIKLPY
jgi:hypothetical protein